MRPILLLLISAAVLIADPPQADAEATLEHAVERYEAGFYGEAAEALRAVAKARPEDPEVAFRLAQATLAIGELDEALEAVERAIAATPERATYHRLHGEILGRHAERASIFRQLGIARDAVRALERAVELDPDDLEARDSLFEYYVQAPGIAGGGKGKALEQVEAVAQRDAAWGHRLRARVAQEDGDTAAAIAAYRASLDAEPGHGRTLLALATLLVDADRQREAADALAPLIAENATCTGIVAYQARFQAGRLAAAGGLDPATGAAALERYLARPPGVYEPPLAEAAYLLGEVERRRGDDSAARRAYQRALELDPNHRDARRALRRL